MNPELICIGASAGGVSAIQKLLSVLTRPLSFPIVVAQHLPPTAQLNLDLVFGRFFKGQLKEVCDKMPLEANTVFFAPGGYHVLIERDRYLSLSQDEHVHFSRPSIDVLFESAAWAFGPRCCGVLLTGANIDGAEGLAAIGQAGGTTVVQDPQEAEVATMPQAALTLFRPNYVLSLSEIGAQISDFSRKTA